MRFLPSIPMIQRMSRMLYEVLVMQEWMLLVSGLERRPVARHFMTSQPQTPRLSQYFSNESDREDFFIFRLIFLMRCLKLKLSHKVRSFHCQLIWFKKKHAIGCTNCSLHFTALPQVWQKKTRILPKWSLQPRCQEACASLCYFSPRKWQKFSRILLMNHTFLTTTSRVVKRNNIMWKTNKLRPLAFPQFSHLHTEYHSMDTEIKMY